VHAIEITGSDALLLELADGARVPARAAPRRHVSRLGVAFRIHAPQRRSLFIAADMLDPAAFRRLRLWALWGRVPGAEGEWHAG
jgi:hypothetical protein